MFELKPTLKSKLSFKIFYECAAVIVSSENLQDCNSISCCKGFDRSLWPAEDYNILAASIAVLSDLSRQKWQILADDETVLVAPPVPLGSCVAEEKARVRDQELVKRDEQLSVDSVRKFIEKMERGHIRGEGVVTIFSLMRDGRQLQDALRQMLLLPIEQRVSELSKVIDPYIQFVSDDAKCEHTGFRLNDIWRYFRHTWSNQYTSIPGRTMNLLVRDRAAAYHPVIGIASIGSPIVQIKERDAWIGWDSSTFIEYIQENPSSEIGLWLRKILNNAVSEIYIEDLLAEGIVYVDELNFPTSEALLRLTQYGQDQRKCHHRFARAREEKKKVDVAKVTDISPWVVKACNHLFRSKRALALADLLKAKISIDHHLKGDVPTKEEIMSLIQDRNGRHAVARVLRKARADRVGIAMADITVCGAIQPYNSILGGKLVGMLAASPEVVQEYLRRYGTTESEIASSMAGRPIIRPARLVFFGTTSLYGVGSSQYNRIVIPASILGGIEGDEIKYIELGRSKSFGTSQFSKETVSYLVDVTQSSSQGQRINHIFGEGVSPKLRKVRDGLNQIGYPSDKLLRHGRQRIVYGVPLVRNLREYLLGMTETPEFLFSKLAHEATQAICDWWRRRWLVRRIEQPHVVEEVGRHTLVRPITHGARVVLPRKAGDEM